MTAEEEQGLQDEAMSAAEQCMELYKEIEIAYPGTEYSHTRSFSEKQRKDVVKRLGEQGFVSVFDDMNIDICKTVSAFWGSGRLQTE